MTAMASRPTTTIKETVVSILMDLPCLTVIPTTEAMLSRYGGRESSRSFTPTNERMRISAGLR